MNQYPSDRHRIHILVTGRVQNVGFRAFVQQTGSRLGLTGWVRNLERDQVETVAEGARQDLEQFLTYLKEGPVGSRVDQAHETWAPASGEFTGFTVRSSR